MKLKYLYLLALAYIAYLAFNQYWPAFIQHVQVEDWYRHGVH